jgi:hypothetical protein
MQHAIKSQQAYTIVNVFLVFTVLTVIKMLICVSLAIAKIMPNVLMELVPITRVYAQLVTQVNIARWT